MMVNLLASCFVVGTVTHVVTKIMTMRAYDNELYDLREELDRSREKINNYRRSGAIEKIPVDIKTYPNETRGLKSIVYHTEYLTLEEAEKRTDKL